MRLVGWTAVALAAIAAIAAPLAAGVGVWTPVGGPAEPVAQVLVDPRQPATLYALADLVGTGYGTLWKSADGGATWSSIQAGVGRPVALLALDPRQSERLYAWDPTEDLLGRLWTSEDGGATWSVRFTAAPGSREPDLRRLVPSPITSGVLYGLASPLREERHPQVFRSLDGGATWRRRGEVGSLDSRSLFADVERDLLYFFDERELSASADGGRSWSVRGRFAGQGFRAMAQAPSAPDVLYALPSAAGTCLARSTDRGATWQRTSAPRLRRQTVCTGLAVDPHDGNLLRLVTRAVIRNQLVFTVFTSADGGRTWSAGSRVPAPYLVASPEPDTLYTGSGDGLTLPGPFKSTDGGRTWNPAYAGIASGELRGGIVAGPSPGGAAVLLAIADVDDLVRSTDGGRTWSALPLQGARGLAADAAKDQVYALSAGRVYRSGDAGGHWQEASPPLPVFGPLLADPTQPRRLFAGLFEDDRFTVWRSIDGGATWGRRSAGLPADCVHYGAVDNCPSFLAVTSDPHRPELVLMAYQAFDLGEGYTETRVYRSTDGGKRWVLAGESPEGVRVLAADPARPGAFLAGTAAGIYRSTDGGDHWTPSSRGLPAGAAILDLLRDGRSGTWYASTERHGIFRSAEGKVWARIDDGLPDRTAPRLLLDPRVADRLLAGVRGQGLWSWRRPPGPG